MAGDYVLKWDILSVGREFLAVQIKCVSGLLSQMWHPNADGAWCPGDSCKSIWASRKVTIYLQEAKEVFSVTNYNGWKIDEKTFKDLGNRAQIFFYLLEGVQPMRVV